MTHRFAELSDTLNGYLQKYREFGIRSNRAVANYLCVDSAELSRLKNARVGDINLQRSYEILRKCEELARRLATFGGPLKCKDVFSAGYSISALPCVSKREQAHAIAVQQQSDSVLLTIDLETQRNELDMLLGDVVRSVAHPRRNPYGPMASMYVLKSLYAAPGATPSQLLNALRVARAGRQACQKDRFNKKFDEQLRRRTLAVIFNNAGGIALRIAKEVPKRRNRMLRLSKFLHQRSLDVFYFPGTIRGALTCADDLQEAAWAKQLLKLLIDREGPERSRWPRGIIADLDDPQEWQFLKRHDYWKLLNGQAAPTSARHVQVQV